MSRKLENRGFVCLHCGRDVLPLENGSYRNHCPFCLSSCHVDVKPGDRASACGGRMMPIGLRQKSGKGMQIVHQYLLCGRETVNKVAENTAQPDEIDALIELSQM